MKKSVASVLLLASLALAGAGGYWLGLRGSPSPSTSAQPAGAAAAKGGGPGGMGGMAVLAEKVAVMPLPQSISAVGSLRSDESVTVRPEIAGRISELPFKEGQRITKGAMLLRLDRSVQAADVQQAKANYV
ncbi:MAG: biotin/lipoyl-binding protein, partial [Betaproteobacteria bacterium]